MHSNTVHLLMAVWHMVAGLDSIRDCIAFPKNNSGRDVMLDAPAALDPSQLDELNLIVDIKE